MIARQPLFLCQTGNSKKDDVRSQQWVKAHCSWQSGPRIVLSPFLDTCRRWVISSLGWCACVLAVDVNTGIVIVGR